jgi:SAM-dependent methyltransferase
VREWLNGQAASGYVTYADGRYALSEEQAVAFTDESSPACVIGGFQAMLAATRAVDRLSILFRTGEGLGWHEHHDDLFCGTERFFRPGYIANLTTSWIPALEGVEGKLRRGAKVADVGCGHGASTIIMARAFPASTFTGFDYHVPSIEAARKAAAEAGLDDRVSFEMASAKEYPGTGYDLVGFFDCLHDMGDPTGAARHVLRSLAPEGTWLLVEPFANDDTADNLNPIGRLFYSVSTLICTPGFAVAGDRYRPRRPGGGDTPARRGDRGWVHAIPAGSRDAVQPGARSPSMRMRMEPAATPAPSPP